MAIGFTILKQLTGFVYFISSGPLPYAGKTGFQIRPDAGGEETVRELLLRLQDEGPRSPSHHELPRALPAQAWRRLEGRRRARQLRLGSGDKFNDSLTLKLSMLLFTVFTIHLYLYLS